MDFQQNCVFIDEAGFYSQMMRVRVWSEVGEFANFKVHTQKDMKISVSMSSTINLSKVKSLKNSDTERL